MVVVPGELEDSELGAGVEAPVLVLLPALVPLPLVLWALLGVVVLVDEGEVPVLGVEVITQGVSATALTGTSATAVAALVGVSASVSLGCADELVATLLVLVLEETRLEQPEEDFELELAVPEVREVDVSPLALDGSLPSEAPTAGALAGPPAIGS